MTFEQFSYFLTVAKHGSFSLAAEELFISQSSLSKQIKALESDLGILLINRKTYPITLTPAGKHFLKLVMGLTKDYKDMLFQMSQFAAYQKNSLRIGSIPILSHYGLMTQILRFQTENPLIRVSLHEYDQKRIWDMLQENLLDLAIIRIDMLPTDDLDIIPLMQEEIVLVCPLEHKLSRKSEASIKDLQNEHFVLVDEKSEIHHLCKAVCQNNGFDPIVSGTSTRHETLMDMIIEGFGISLIPRNLVNPEIYPQLAFIPLKEKIQSTTALVKKTSQNEHRDLTLLFNYFLNKTK